MALQTRLEAGKTLSEVNHDENTVNVPEVDIAILAPEALEENDALQLRRFLRQTPRNGSDAPQVRHFECANKCLTSNLGSSGFRHPDLLSNITSRSFGRFTYSRRKQLAAR